MKKNVINEDEIFEINPNYTVKVETFQPGNVKVVMVDDFYKNPWDVRQLALDIPASRNRRIRGMNPAYRVNAFYELDSMFWIYDQLIRTHFHEYANDIDTEYLRQSFRNATFMVNVMQSEDLPPLCPHMDNTSGINFASTIYLNEPNECKGGTSFYTYGGKTYYEDQHQMQTLDVAGKLPIHQYVTDSVGDFEMIGMAPMLFNRMVLYKQEALHTAYVKPGMFRGDVHRLNQQFFI